MDKVCRRPSTWIWIYNFKSCHFM